MRRFAAAIAIAMLTPSLSALIACVPQRPELVHPTQAQLPLPTMDEVVRVDGRAITISEFRALRRQLTSSNVETVLWAGTAIILLQNEAKEHGVILTPETGLAISRYALGEIPLPQAETALRSYFTSAPGPETVRQVIDRISSKSLIQRNATVLAELRTSMR